MLDIKVSLTDDQNLYILSSVYNAILINEDFDLKFILTLLNSQLFQFQLKLIAFDKTKGAFTKARIFHYYELPIKTISKQSQQSFIEKADIMLSLNKQKQEKINKFLHRLETNFKIEKLSNKMKAFYDYDFITLISELKKKKIKLTLSQQDEWEEYFNTFKEKINQLQNQIDKTDKEIDQMVYELYGLTKEEIEIIEKR